MARLVQPVSLVLTAPEHDRLEQLLADNPAVVVVGLAWVTELEGGPGDRTYYHCALGPCRDEQGTARCGVGAAV
jgi:hypothetical protein